MLQTILRCAEGGTYHGDFTEGMVKAVNGKVCAFLCGEGQGVHAQTLCGAVKVGGKVAYAVGGVGECDFYAVLGACAGLQYK